ncbi:hypothetical protein RHMOL_Rhmol09G0054600 [Rhododendron molle]|uniref:Uncharacterized protein n=1 Tax=Rhododendron molle TaxID=49168 RepID=A0ACC0MA58_RHOML|nr:hypothetical protein RHMOL_Rhmol09G0054600 [Rhododendron molle]
MMWWFSFGFTKLEKQIWETRFFSTVWSIWLAHNERIFSNSTVEAVEVSDIVKTRVVLTFGAPTHACIYSADKEPPKSSSNILQYPSAFFGVNEGRLPWQMNRVSSGYTWRPLVQSFTSEIGEKRVIHEWIVRQYCEFE